MIADQLLQYNAMQYFIDTPPVGLFSDNGTSNINLLIRINYIINIITTYYTKCILKLNYNKMNTNKILLLVIFKYH